MRLTRQQNSVQAAPAAAVNCPGLLGTASVTLVWSLGTSRMRNVHTFPCTTRRKDQTTRARTHAHGGGYAAQFSGACCCHPGLPRYVIWPCPFQYIRGIGQGASTFGQRSLSPSPWSRAKHPDAVRWFPNNNETRPSCVTSYDGE